MPTALDDYMEWKRGRSAETGTGSALDDYMALKQRGGGRLQPLDPAGRTAREDALAHAGLMPPGPFQTAALHIPVEQGTAMPPPAPEPAHEARPAPQPQGAWEGFQTGLSHAAFDNPVTGRINRWRYGIPQEERLEWKEGTRPTTGSSLAQMAGEQVGSLADPLTATSMFVPGMAGGRIARAALPILVGGMAAGEAVGPGRGDLGERAVRAGLAAGTGVAMAGGGRLAGRLVPKTWVSGAAGGIVRPLAQTAGEMVGGAAGGAGSAAIEGGDIGQGAFHGAAIPLAWHVIGTGGRILHAGISINPKQVAETLGKVDAKRAPGRPQLHEQGSISPEVYGKVRDAVETVAAKSNTFRDGVEVRIVDPSDPDIAGNNGITVPEQIIGADGQPTGRYRVVVKINEANASVFDADRILETVAHEATHAGDHLAGTFKGTKGIAGWLAERRALAAELESRGLRPAMEAARGAREDAARRIAEAQAAAAPVPGAEPPPSAGAQPPAQGQPIPAQGQGTARNVPEGATVRLGKKNYTRTGGKWVSETGATVQGKLDSRLTVKHFASPGGAAAPGAAATPINAQVAADAQRAALKGFGYTDSDFDTLATQPGMVENILKHKLPKGGGATQASEFNASDRERVKRYLAESIKSGESRDIGNQSREWRDGARAMGARVWLDKERKTWMLAPRQGEPTPAAGEGAASWSSEELAKPEYATETRLYRGRRVDVGLEDATPMLPSSERRPILPEVGEIGQLTADQRKLLIQAVRSNPADYRARAQLIAATEGLVGKLANKYRGMMPREDLMQEGRDGLMSAVDAVAEGKYDPDEAGFNAYAGTAIANAMSDAIAKNKGAIRVPSDAARAARRLAGEATEALTKQIRRLPSKADLYEEMKGMIAEAAPRLKVSENELRAAVDAQFAKTTSVDANARIREALEFEGPGQPRLQSGRRRFNAGDASIQASEPTRADREKMEKAIKAGVWYSPLRRAVEEKMGGRMSGEQLMKMLAAAPGVKPEEIEWTKLREFLAGKPSVTKQEVLDHLEANAVRVEEVVKGGPAAGESGFAIAERRLARDGTPYWEVVNHTTGQRYGPQHMTREAAEEGLAEARAQEWNPDFPQTSGVRHSRWQAAPGGENYRELLLRMGDSRVDTMYALQRQMQALEAKGSLSGGEEMQLRDMEKRFHELSNPQAQPEFLGAHWDEPNVLAHVRFSDFTDAQGRKVLTLQEIQSDWADMNRDALGKIAKPESIGELADNVFGRQLGSMMPLNEMDGGVLAALKHDQVSRAVIASLPVEVVDDLKAAHLSADQVFRNPDVLIQHLPLDHVRSVATGILAGARNVGTRLRAKLLVARAAGGDIELLPALNASDLSSREVVGLLSPQSIYHMGLAGEARGGKVTGPGAEGLTGTRQVAGGAAERLAAAGAGAKAGRGEAGTGAETPPRSAGAGQELGPASLTGILNWHTKIISQTAASLQAKYMAAPLVGKTSDYMSLTMKRMVRWAAEHGYDRIAWPKGEAQAEIYNKLLRDVKAIHYNKVPDDEVSREYPGENEYAVMTRSTQGGNKYLGTIPESKLAETFGKDVAKRIIAGESTHDPEQGKLAFGWKERVIEFPEGMTLGGEGMAKFYDEMLVNETNKLIKKYGGRVEEGTIQSGGPKEWKRWPDASELGTYQAEIDARPQSVHAFDITPALRLKAMTEGMAQFQEPTRADLEKMRAAERIRRATGGWAGGISQAQAPGAAAIPGTAGTVTPGKPTLMDRVKGRVADQVALQRERTHNTWPMISRVMDWFSNHAWGQTRKLAPEMAEQMERMTQKEGTYRARDIMNQMDPRLVMSPDGKKLAEKFIKAQTVRQWEGELQKAQATGDAERIANAQTQMDTQLQKLFGGSEAAYRIALQDPGVAGLLPKWDERVSQIQERAYRVTTGMNPEVGTPQEGDTQQLHFADVHHKAAGGVRDFRFENGRWVMKQPDGTWDVAGIGKKTAAALDGLYGERPDARRYGHMHLIMKDAEPWLGDPSGRTDPPSTRAGKFRKTWNPFSERAYGTHEGKPVEYETDMQTVLAKSTMIAEGASAPIETIKAGIKEGVMAWQAQGQSAAEAGVRPGWTKIRDVDLPIQNTRGNRDWVHGTLYADPRIAPDVLAVHQAMDTAKPATLFTSLASLVVRTQVALGTDLFGHVPNIVLQTASAMSEAARLHPGVRSRLAQNLEVGVRGALPPVNAAWTAAQGYRIDRALQRGAPEETRVAAKLEKAGIIRPVEALDYTNLGGHIIHRTDAAFHVLLEMAREAGIDGGIWKDAPGEMVNFHARLGLYNPGYSGTFINWARRYVGTFAVAAKTFSVEGVKRLVTASGTKAASWPAWAVARMAGAWGLLGGAIVIPKLINEAVWGQDPNYEKVKDRIPIGHLMLAMPDDPANPTAKVKTLNFPFLSGKGGALTRLGLGRAMETLRAGGTYGQALDDVKEGVLRTGSRLTTGPLTEPLGILATGQTMFGIKALGGRPVVTETSGTDWGQRLAATAKFLNPTIERAIDAPLKGDTWQKSLAQIPLRMTGYTESAGTMSGAARMAREMVMSRMAQSIPDEHRRAARDYQESIRQAIRAGMTPEQAIHAVDIPEGIDANHALRAWGDAKYDRALVTFRQLSVPQARQVYALATPQERAAWKGEFVAKEANAIVNDISARLKQGLKSGKGPGITDAERVQEAHLRHLRTAYTRAKNGNPAVVPQIVNQMIPLLPTEAQALINSVQGMNLNQAAQAVGHTPEDFRRVLQTGASNPAVAARLDGRAPGWRSIVNSEAR